MFCSKCGHEIEDDSKFCTKCGTVVSNDQEEFIDQSMSNNQAISTNVPKPETRTSHVNNGNETKHKSFGFVLSQIIIVVGVLGALRVVVFLTHHGTYGSDWDNEVVDILWGIRLALNILIIAIGVLIAQFG